MTRIATTKADAISGLPVLNEVTTQTRWATHRDGEDDARHLHETVRPGAERSQPPGVPRLDGVRSRERSLTRPFMEREPP